MPSSNPYSSRGITINIHIHLSYKISTTTTSPLPPSFAVPLHLPSLHLLAYPPPVNSLTTPTEKLSITPSITNTCIRRDHTPSSLPNHPTTPSGKKNPTIIPRINGSATALSPYASSVPPTAPPPPSSHPPPPVPVPAPPPPNHPAVSSYEEGSRAPGADPEWSSQASSMARSESGEGMASGVKRAVWMARKWERRVEISAGVRPA
ncbi:hypothetical protein VTK26DRAFT_1702 [Humicola hyalothermophila]